MNRIPLVKIILATSLLMFGIYMFKGVSKVIQHQKKTIKAKSHFLSNLPAIKKTDLNSEEIALFKEAYQTGHYYFCAKYQHNQHYPQLVQQYLYFFTTFYGYLYIDHSTGRVISGTQHGMIFVGGEYQSDYLGDIVEELVTWELFFTDNLVYTESPLFWVTREGDVFVAWVNVEDREKLLFDDEIYHLGKIYSLDRCRDVKLPYESRWRR